MFGVFETMRELGVEEGEGVRLVQFTVCVCVVRAHVCVSVCACVCVGV